MRVSVAVPADGERSSVPASMRCLAAPIVAHGKRPSAEPALRIE
jgi:hypothetical protein